MTKHSDNYFEITDELVASRKITVIAFTLAKVLVAHKSPRHLPMPAAMIELTTSFTRDIQSSEGESSAI